MTSTRRSTSRYDNDGLARHLHADPAGQARRRVPCCLTSRYLLHHAGRTVGRSAGRGDARGASGPTESICSRQRPTSSRWRSMRRRLAPSACGRRLCGAWTKAGRSGLRRTHRSGRHRLTGCRSTPATRMTSEASLTSPCTTSRIRTAPPTDVDHSVCLSDKQHYDKLSQQLHSARSPRVLRTTDNLIETTRLVFIARTCPSLPRHLVRSQLSSPDSACGRAGLAGGSDGTIEEPAMGKAQCAADTSGLDAHRMPWL